MENESASGIPLRRNECRPARIAVCGHGVGNENDTRRILSLQKEDHFLFLEARARYLFPLPDDYRLARRTSRPISPISSEQTGRIVEILIGPAEECRSVLIDSCR